MPGIGSGLVVACARLCASVVKAMELLLALALPVWLALHVPVTLALGVAVLLIYYKNIIRRLTSRASALLLSRKSRCASVVVSS